MARQDDYTRITARIPPEVHDALVELANEEERSLNGELVARLQIAIALAKGEPRRPFEARQNGAIYEVGSTADILIKLVSDLPESKQRALIVLLQAKS